MLILCINLCSLCFISLLTNYMPIVLILSKLELVFLMLQSRTKEKYTQKEEISI